MGLPVLRWWRWTALGRFLLPGPVPTPGAAQRLLRRNLGQAGVSCRMSLALDADTGAALQAARARFAPEMDTVMRALRKLLDGRDPRELVGRECVDHFVLRERFNETADAQRDFAEAELARGRQLAA